MTYVGAWFNGLTLLILGLVSMFSLPKTYEVYQEQIDAYLALAQDQVKGIMAHLKKQMPKDLDEAKDMAMKLYNSVVELIHAKIPIEILGRSLKEEKWVKQSLSATPLTATTRNQLDECNPNDDPARQGN